MCLSTYAPLFCTELHNRSSSSNARQYRARVASRWFQVCHPYLAAVRLRRRPHLLAHVSHPQRVRHSTYRQSRLELDLHTLVGKEKWLLGHIIPASCSLFSSSSPVYRLFCIFVLARVAWWLHIRSILLRSTYSLVLFLGPTPERMSSDVSYPLSCSLYRTTTPHSPPPPLLRPFMMF